MKWATRPGVHVDRAACAWLICRFVDPGAEFVFADDPAAVPADATPFDIRGATLGHHQGRCSFETALETFGLTDDPALEEIGHIVHEADLADDRYDAPAAAGLDVLIRGLTLTSGSDHDTLAVTGRLFDGLDADADQAGLTVAEAAYTYAAGSPYTDTTARYGRSFLWRCRSCDQAISDRGLIAGPADDELGHTDNCPRLAAAIAEWNAGWEAEP
jgi:hypothetical protein